MSKVLIVDDDDTIRETLCDLLSESYSCQMAENAQQALTHLAQGSYDLVLTDLSMPGLNGAELLKIIREQYANTRVIVISGMGDEDRARDLIEQGALDVLTKPFILEVVEETVKRALDGSGG